MSTPSTATATHPSQHYGYSHHQTFQPSAVSYPTTTASVASPRLAAYNYPAGTQPAPSNTLLSSTSSKPPVTHPTMATYQPSTTLPTASSRRKKPNWAEFYKNGVPKEIIVIDDDDDEVTAVPPPTTTVRKAAAVRPAQDMAVNGNTQPATKRRRTGLANTYDLTQYDQPAYSIRPQQFGDDASATSISTDRTNSLHTTAPTSLGSHASSSTNGVYHEDVSIGQKRKRVTRKTTREEQKRRELEVVGDAFASYIPPPKPPLKAKDLHVRVAPDYSKNQEVDDDDGHYIVQQNTDLAGRYTIIKQLGQGTFGKVVEAYDRQKKIRCAVKIIRSVQKYRDASRIELRVLSTLALNDKTNRNKCIHLRDYFDFKNHICIVTDLLGPSVFDFLKANKFTPFPSSQIQSFARQLFTSVAFLHDVNLIHTDLKPENILLVNSAYQTFTYNRTMPSSSHSTNRSQSQRRVLLDSEIRLIDFGSATFDDEYHSSVVSTRHYRAPEIILNLGWSFPCDIWSIGCILVEFFTGDALFQTHDNLEHLAMMEPVCGRKIEPKLVRQVVQGRGSQSNSAAKYFNRNKLDYPNSETSRASRKYVKAMKQLHEFIPSNTAFNRQFLDLLRKIFVYDPKARITAKQALQHPWFKETIIDDGTEATRIHKELRQNGR